jgi:hypothetical protein
MRIPGKIIRDFAFQSGSSGTRTADIFPFIMLKKSFNSK